MSNDNFNNNNNINNTGRHYTGRGNNETGRHGTGRMNDDAGSNNTGRHNSGGSNGTGRMNDKSASDRTEPPAPADSGRARKKPFFLFRAADTTIELISSIISGFFKVFGTLLLIIAVTGMLFACVFAYYVKTSLTPNLDISLDDYKLNQSSTIYYQDAGGEWRELGTISGRQNRVWVDYSDIPWYMEKAVVAIEDKRFYDHKGVDWYRTSGAFIKMFATMQNSYGGSTITQQLIKNLTGQDQVTVQRKLTEIFGALELEKRYDKQEIIEWYLNAVYFGEGCYGVQTAAQTYFGKDVSELSLAECASIVGITNKPTYYDPFYNEENNKERQETILREMYEQGYIDYQMYTDAVAEELVFTRSVDDDYTQRIYSYYEEVVIDDLIHDLMERKGISREAATTLVYNGGYKIYCCLDVGVQSAIDSIYTDLSAIPGGTRNGEQLQSAIVVMNPFDGRILGLAGGVGTKDRNFPLNRATGTYRSPGSSIKPLASYGPAVDMGLITPTTLVNDMPGMHLSGTNWFPANDSNFYFYGTVTIYQALENSLNTVAAQIVDKLTPQTSYNYLTSKLGFTSLLPSDADYAPMALGQMAYGVTVREMAQAYCSFVNDGVFTYGRTYSLVTDFDGNTIIDNSPVTIDAFKPNTAYTMTYMLQNAVENGTGKEARLYNMPVAGKTGSSTDYKDRWFCGVTPYYCAAVWTGYDIPQVVTGNGNPAAQLWRKVMQQLHDGLEYKAFTYPYIGENTGIFGITNGYTSDLDTGTDDDFTGWGSSSGDTGLDWGSGSGDTGIDWGSGSGDTGIDWGNNSGGTGWGDNSGWGGIDWGNGTDYLG